MSETTSNKVRVRVIDTKKEGTIPMWQAENSNILAAYVTLDTGEEDFYSKEQLELLISNETGN